MRNLKLAFRTLFKTPFVTAVAVLSLALGIGANAAIFSLFNEMLLRSLPVREPDRLVDLSAPGPKFGSTSCGQAGDCDVVFSYPMFRDLERAKTPLSGLAGHVVFGANLAFRNQTLNADAVFVSGSYFPVLGVSPALGRLLAPADDQTIGAHFVAVLTYSYWENKLGRDPGVLNDKIIVNGQPMTIVGVAPKGFDGTTLGERPQVFVPLTMRSTLTSRRDLEERQSYWLYLFGRLKPGATLDEAKRGINAIYKPIINDIEAPLQKGMSPATMAKFRAKEVTVEPGDRGQSSMHTETKTPLALLFGITGIVLLIACANIANLLLARAANRSMEMAVRLSLGASRRQLITQLLTESIVLAALGGIVSILVAKWTLGGIGSMLKEEAREMLALGLSVPVVTFAALLSLVTGLLFGLFPALHSTRSDLITSIRAGAGQISGGHRTAVRFRTSLVTAQIALSMALLIAAGLFIRSLENVSRVDLGLKLDHVITFGISPELNGYKPDRSRALLDRVQQELTALPGVTAVSASRVPLLAGSNWGNSVAVEGFKRNPDTDDGSRFNEVSPGYFKTLGVPLIAGREFAEGDNVGTPQVAIVNEAFAKKFNLGRNAVGKRMGNGGPGPEKLDIEIVGLVQNAKYSDVKQEIPPLYFTPTRQDSTIGHLNFFVRTSQEPELLLKTIAAVVKRVDPTLPVENLRTMPQQVRENVFLDRMIGTLSSSFALLATLLAAVGLYGVLAYTVAQRTREIGVRMALGADGPRVRGMVLRQVAWMTVVGGVIGIAGALALGKAASSLLYQLKGNDPVVVIVSATLLTIVALGAGYIPALRASRVEPMRALRYE